MRNFTFPEGEFHYLIHAATESSARQAAELPSRCSRPSLRAPERALDFAAAHGTRKFLLTSSGAVYGKQPSNLTHIPEDYLGGPDPLDPASVYAEGKRVAEQMCVLRSVIRKVRVGVQDRPLLRLRGTAFAARRPLRRRQFHPGCAGRPAHPHQWRRDSATFVPLCIGPRRLALDHPLSRPRSACLQCRLRAVRVHPGSGAGEHAPRCGRGWKSVSIGNRWPTPLFFAMCLPRAALARSLD